MLLCKFKLSLISFLFCVSVFSFTDNECLDTDYHTEVIHKGFPMGLTMNKLTLKKGKCIITLSHQKMKYIKKEWVIDVCREPVHIKKGNGPVEVIKRTETCGAKSGDSFCGQYREMMEVIQDDGLIFAEGEKEDLSSNHGKVYCAYVLLKVYMGDGVVLSRHKTYSKLFGSEVKSFEGSADSINDQIPPPRPQVEGEQEDTSKEDGSGPISL
jgi:hypothetical protein